MTNMANWLHDFLSLPRGRARRKGCEAEGEQFTLLAISILPLVARVHPPYLAARARAPLAALAPRCMRGSCY